MQIKNRLRVLFFHLLLALLPLIVSACGAQASDQNHMTVRLGYFPNITHSQALIGIARGDFKTALGETVDLQTAIFNAGPSVIEALFAGQIDIAYIGPNPAINGYVKSKGEAVRIIAGATSGGAAFIVHPNSGILSAQDLSGKRIASPQLGNTQDVALRAYLMENDLQPTEKGGTVQIIPTDNPLILDLLRQGQIDGAWVPEPWASRLIIQGEGVLFLDERDIWPNGQFVTAHIIVHPKFLQEHPDIVKKFLKAHILITVWEQEHPEEAKQVLNAEIEKITGKPLTSDVMDMAWSRMDITYDPIISSLFESAEDAFRVGFLSEKPLMANIYDLSLLNQVLLELNLELIPEG